MGAASTLTKGKAKMKTFLNCILTVERLVGEEEEGEEERKGKKKHKGKMERKNVFVTRVLL